MSRNGFRIGVTCAALSVLAIARTISAAAPALPLDEAIRLAVAGNFGLSLARDHRERTPGRLGDTA